MNIQALGFSIVAFVIAFLVLKNIVEAKYDFGYYFWAGLVALGVYLITL